MAEGQDPRIRTSGPNEPEVSAVPGDFRQSRSIRLTKKKGGPEMMLLSMGHSGPSTWTSSRCALVVCSAKVPLAWGCAG